jgi:hypothetical protein
VTARNSDDAHLIDAAMAIHADAPVFGYRFAACELPDHGITADETVSSGCARSSGCSLSSPRNAG